jgi:methyl-accepting chemotaxis protein
MELMANPLPSGLPPRFWDDLCKRYEDEIAFAREQLQRLESGDLHVTNNHRDETSHWIAHFRATVVKFQGIIDAVKKGEVP